MLQLIVPVAAVMLSGTRFSRGSFAKPARRSQFPGLRPVLPEFKFQLRETDVSAAVGPVRKD
jgi:hypothetical protein